MNSRSDEIQHKLMKTNDIFKELFAIYSTSYIITASTSSGDELKEIRTDSKTLK